MTSDLKSWGVFPSGAFIALAIGSLAKRPAALLGAKERPGAAHCESEGSLWPPLGVCRCMIYMQCSYTKEKGWRVQKALESSLRFLSGSVISWKKTWGTTSKTLFGSFWRAPLFVPFLENSLWSSGSRFAHRQRHAAWWPLHGGMLRLQSSVIGPPWRSETLVLGGAWI